MVHSLKDCSNQPNLWLLIYINKLKAERFKRVTSCSRGGLYGCTTIERTNENQYINLKKEARIYFGLLRYYKPVKQMYLRIYFERKKKNVKAIDKTNKNKWRNKKRERKKKVKAN